ncbi:hypothetical protein [Legionella brunensis]|uniref:Uncharacterized protein n=1 Tax=Legionella brunensis TaxID=29422 RepID=A0A0W0SNP6_9GAMM|nr:hypothetical protein [Legionella brunensis]KTC85010.1 hypothetical protein Lbru_1225 [Legionella brunensis]
MQARPTLFESIRFPNIQFIWIGPPKTIDLLHPEMDLDGPLQFYNLFKQNEINHKIFFYCLDEYCQAFQELLFPKYKIEIRGLEACFMENYEKLKKANLSDAITIFNDNKVGDLREKVAAKDLASLLILYLYGDYFLDTTIVPTQMLPKFETYAYFQAPLLSEDKLNVLSSEDLGISKMLFNQEGPLSSPFFYVNLLKVGDVDTLDHFEKKCLKKLTGRDTSIPIKKRKTMDIDCFIMFSPQYSPQVKQAIAYFIFFYPLLNEEKIAAKSSNNYDTEIIERYYDSHSTLMLLAVTNGYYLVPVKAKEQWYADLPSSPNEISSRIIEPLHIKKIFKDSHTIKIESTTSSNTEDDYVIFSNDPYSI